MESVTVRRVDATVLLINNTLKVGLEMRGWRAADELGHAIAYMARGVIAGDRQQVTRSVAVQRDGDQIVVERQGAVFVRMPAAAALEVGNGILAKARLIEEDEQVDQVVFDQALLDRSGRLPGIQLTADPVKRELALKEALHNTKLRRAVRNRMRGTVIPVGHPRVIKSPAPKED